MEHHRSQHRADEWVNVEKSRLSPHAPPFIPRAPPSIPRTSSFIPSATPSARKHIRITTPSGVPIVLPSTSPSRPNFTLVADRYDSPRYKEKRERRQARKEAKWLKELAEHPSGIAGTNPASPSATLHEPSGEFNNTVHDLGSWIQRLPVLPQPMLDEEPQVDEMQPTSDMNENDMSEENPSPERV